MGSCYLPKYIKNWSVCNKTCGFGEQESYYTCDTEPESKCSFLTKPKSEIKKCYTDVKCKDGQKCDNNEDCEENSVCDYENDDSKFKTCGIRKNCVLSDFKVDKLNALENVLKIIDLMKQK